MELKQLQYFLAVAEQLNFSKAAETLFVTQPLLSQQVADLEQQLGVTLFNRTRRSVRLTPAGEALRREALSVLEQVNGMQNIVSRAAAGIGTECELKIGFEEVFERTRLTQAVFRFRESYPSYHCELRQYNFGQITRALHDGDIDLGFTLLPNKKLSQELMVRTVGEDSLVLAASSRLLDEASPERALLLSESLPVCLMDNDARGMNSILRLCIEMNVSPQFRFYEDIQTLLMNVEAGSGLTFLPGTVLDTYASPYITCVALSGHEYAKLTLAACWNRTNANPAIAPFLDCLAEEQKTDRII